MSTSTTTTSVAKATFVESQISTPPQKERLPALGKGSTQAYPKPGVSTSGIISLVRKYY